MKKYLHYSGVFGIFWEFDGNDFRHDLYCCSWCWFEMSAQNPFEYTVGRGATLLATRTYEQRNPNCYSSVGTLHSLAQRAVLRAFDFLIPCYFFLLLLVKCSPTVFWQVFFLRFVKVLTWLLLRRRIYCYGGWRVGTKLEAICYAPSLSSLQGIQWPQK